VLWVGPVGLLRFYILGFMFMLVGFPGALSARWLGSTRRLERGSRTQDKMGETSSAALSARSTTSAWVKP